MLQITNCPKNSLVWKVPSEPAMFANSRKDLPLSHTCISWGPKTKMVCSVRCRAGRTRILSRVRSQVMYSLSDFQNPTFARRVTHQIAKRVWNGPSKPAMFGNSRKDVALSATEIC